MGITHRVRINVSVPGHGERKILEAGERRLPARFLKWLFGDYSTAYLLSPGQTIESVEIHETGNHTTEPKEVV